MRPGTRDPIGYGSGDWNLYVYVRSSPAFRIDPFGLQTQLIPDLEKWPRDPGHVFPHFPEIRPWPPTGEQGDPPYTGADPLTHELSEVARLFASFEDGFHSCGPPLRWTAATTTLTFTTLAFTAMGSGGFGLAAAGSVSLGAGSQLLQQHGFEG